MLKERMIKLNLVEKWSPIIFYSSNKIPPINRGLIDVVKLAECLESYEKRYIDYPHILKMLLPQIRIQLDIPEISMIKRDGGIHYVKISPYIDESSYNQKKYDHILIPVENELDITSFVSPPRSILMDGGMGKTIFRGIDL